MANTGMTVALIGGVIAVVGQWWGSDLVSGIGLPLIGGVLAIIGAFMK